mmetsp:Transcript_12180/g.30756  ORF Transcript_12180/g.30756 Transcript_12180/m.30756 type:complete len:253 (-) Transcript_12180:2302-3060(-)
MMTAPRRAPPWMGLPQPRRARAATRVACPRARGKGGRRKRTCLMRTLLGLRSTTALWGISRACWMRWVWRIGSQRGRPAISRYHPSSGSHRGTSGTQAGASSVPASGARRPVFTAWSRGRARRARQPRTRCTGSQRARSWSTLPSPPRHCQSCCRRQAQRSGSATSRRRKSWSTGSWRLWQLATGRLPRRRPAPGLERATSAKWARCPSSARRQRTSGCLAWTTFMTSLALAWTPRRSPALTCTATAKEWWT